MIPGTRIGKYEVRRLLGQGGFGVVFVGHDTALDRACALKFLLPEHTRNPELLQRFLKEARSAARIDHGGIVTVFECGLVEGAGPKFDGTAFIAMELLKGESLADRLKRGPLPIDSAIQIARQVASALAAAHAVGIVHRDLKPDNIYLVPDPATTLGERVKVLDFGIAKLADEAGDSNKTATHMIFGTPRYMSPEQCRSTAKVDERSDVYALGCILFEMVCGRPPFEGDAGELIAMHQLVPAPPASTLRADLPPTMDAAISAMLAKKPEDRFARMTDVLGILGAPVAATHEVALAHAAVAPTIAPDAMTGAPVVATASPPSPHIQLAPTMPSVAAAPRIASAPAIAKATVRRNPKRWLAVGVGLMVAVVLVIAFAMSDGVQRDAAVDTLTDAGNIQTDAPSVSLVERGIDYDRRAKAMIAEGKCAQLAQLRQQARVESPRLGNQLDELVCIRCPSEMVPVASGTFSMGSHASTGRANERPQRAVTLHEYCIDRTEVTVAAYTKCVATGKCAPASEKADTVGFLCNGTLKDRQDHPINCVDWTEAQAYCAALSKRLPSEAEWEYAARGLDQRVYPWGNTEPTAQRLNACGTECRAFTKRIGLELKVLFEQSDRWETTAPVGSFPDGVSPFGALDMAGNVWEWTGDWYGPYPSVASTDPRGPADGTERVLRGGGFNTGDDDVSVRAAFRYWYAPADRHVFVGFRCARGE